MEDCWLIENKKRKKDAKVYKKRRRHVGPTCVNGADSERKNIKIKEKKKKRRRRNDVAGDDFRPTGDDVARDDDCGPTCDVVAQDIGDDVAESDGHDEDFGPTGDDVAEDDGFGPTGDDVAEADGDDDGLGQTGDDVAGISSDGNRNSDSSSDDDLGPTCDDVAEADDDVADKSREMVKKKKKEKEKSIGDMIMKAINQVAKAASEAALSAYIASQKNTTLTQVEHNSSKSVEDRSPKELAEHALLSYNESARLRRSQEYQFVKVKSYNRYNANDASTTVWYHLNFVARPTVGTQEFTFFAEIKEHVTRVLVTMCVIVALTSNEIPCLGGCKICDKDECRDVVIHPITGIRKESEIETSSIEENQHHISSHVWTKRLPTSSMKLKPIHDPKPPL